MYNIKKRLLTRPTEGYIEHERMRTEIINEHIAWLNGRMPSQIYAKYRPNQNMTDSPIDLYLKDTPERKFRERQQRRLKKCRQL